MEQAVPTPTVRRYTAAEYFRIEATSEQKHEFRHGELIAMAGGTESHSLIIMNTGGELRSRLRDVDCRVYDSNLRVRARRDVRYVYPDVFVTCGPREFDTDDPQHLTVLNPKVVVEVLSPSTELADRGEKFAYYLQCPSLEEYVLIAQHEARVETYLRQPDGTWSFAYFVGPDATARVRSLGVDLPLAEVYAKVVFPPPPPPEPSNEGQSRP